MQRTGSDRWRRIVSLFLPLVVFLALVAIDQISKYYFKDLYTKQGTTVVIEDFFAFTFTMNTGAAWSFLAGVSWAQTFFKILTGVSLVLLGLFLFYVYKKNYRWLKYALVLIISGTIGNFIDRLILNGVIDFLSFTFWGWAFPVFNFADSCLTVGVIMLIVHYLFLDKDALFKFGKKQETLKGGKDERAE